MTLDDIWSAIVLEQARARELHGNGWVGWESHLDADRLPVLMEEVGEVATAIQDGDVVALRTELVQVAAVAVSWLQTLEGPE